jgi:hypothetical protein
VVDGKSKEAKQTTQRVVSPAVDSIHFSAAYGQPAVVAKRALAPALENGEGRPVEVRIRPAVTAVKRGFGEDLEEDAPVVARSLAPAFAAIGHFFSFNE